MNRPVKITTGSENGSTILNPRSAELFLYKPWGPKVFYEWMAIINSFTVTVRG